MNFKEEVTILLKKCDIGDQLKSLIGTEVTIYIDRHIWYQTS